MVRHRSYCWALTLLLALNACSGLPRPFFPKDALTAEEHVRLGEAYAAQKNPRLATAEFEAALARDSQYVPALVALGNVHFDTGGLDAAEAHYRRALAIAPEHPGAANNLAMVYLSRGERLEEAEALAQAALQQNTPLRPYILETLASLHLKLGWHRSAQRYLDEAEVSTPSDNIALRARLEQLRETLARYPGGDGAPRDRLGLDDADPPVP